MAIDLSKLKNKEARMNMMAFCRIRAEKELPEELEDQFYELIVLAAKLKTLQNTHMTFVSEAEPEDRVKLAAAKVKLSLLRRQMLDLMDILDNLGVNSKKFAKNQDHLATKGAEFSYKCGELNSILPDGMSVQEISPYLESFLTDD